jgi:hypothetical protein
MMMMMMVVVVVVRCTLWSTLTFQRRSLSDITSSDVSIATNIANATMVGIYKNTVATIS